MDVTLDDNLLEKCKNCGTNRRLCTEQSENEWKCDECGGINERDDLFDTFIGDLGVRNKTAKIQQINKALRKSEKVLDSIIEKFLPSPSKVSVMKLVEGFYASRYCARSVERIRIVLSVCAFISLAQRGDNPLPQSFIKVSGLSKRSFRVWVHRICHIMSIKIQPQPRLHTLEDTLRRFLSWLAVYEAPKHRTKLPALPEPTASQPDLTSDAAISPYVPQLLNTELSREQENNSKMEFTPEHTSLSNEDQWNAMFSEICDKSEGVPDDTSMELNRLLEFDQHPSDMITEFRVPEETKLRGEQADAMKMLNSPMLLKKWVENSAKMWNGQNDPAGLGTALILSGRPLVPKSILKIHLWSEYLSCNRSALSRALSMARSGYSGSWD